MSAKFLHVFSEENPEIQKQIGCMTGIFQMFDRQHHLLTGRSHRNHKRHHISGHALPTSGADHGVGSPQIILEKNFSKSSNENQRVSMESSRTSFSSSSCSSFSSVECSKSTPQESISFERSGFQEKASKNSPRLKTSNVDGRPPRSDTPNASLQTARRSLDFREVVKDSINRDSRGLSVKTSAKEEVKSHVLKHIDSPRPMQLSKSVDGSYMIGVNGKSREAVDLNESLRVFFKLKEAPWNFSEDGGESPRTSFEAPKAHRFSYDGREISRQSLDSRENNGKFPSKLRELPRLSLDSREGYMRNSSFNLRPNSSLKELERSSSDKRVSISSNSSVVAKLMGLELMPGLNMSTEDSDNFNKQDLLSRSPTVSFKDPIIPQVKKDPVSIKKPIPNSRVPIETAPWRQQEKQRKVPEKTKVIHREESVYSEIEKRLKELEFREANKDLRALKQILDAMQAKGLLEKKNTDLTTRENQNNKPSASSNRTKESRTSGSYQSPIVIMKPAKSIKRSGVATTSSVLLMDKKKASTNDHLKETSKRIEDGPYKARSRTRENGGSSLSPRLQQKRVESEKPQRPSSSSSNKKQTESVSPRSKNRQRSTQVQNSDEQMSESSETRNSSYMGDEISQRSDSNISLASRTDIEVTSADRSGDMNSRSPSGRAARKAASAVKQKIQKKHSTGSSGDVLAVEFVMNATDEFPSSSPLKKKSNTPKGEKKQTGSTDSQTQTSSSEINQKKLRSIENLVQKLRELSSTDDKDDQLSPADHIASLCETHNPDHRYVSEILLASGLLMKDLTAGPMGPKPIQLHPSGHPINPDLFLVLEQTKTIKDNTKLHRKLVFDMVNEILIKKLDLTSSGPHPDYLFRAGNLAGRFPSGQKLLKEVCLDIEKIQAEIFDDEIKISDEEILRQSEGWADFGNAVPGLVLEIERSIFKDLIDEVVSGEAVHTSQSKTNRRRKQLFSK